MNDFYDWKKHPITEAIFGEIRSRVDSLLAELVDQAATSSQAELAEKAGAIKAFRDLLNISVEDFVQETE